MNSTATGSFGPGDYSDEDGSATGDGLWRVFVLLRDRPGVYGCTIRASGPLAAEEAVATGHNEVVLETLGSESVGDLAPIDPHYLRFHVAGHRTVAGTGPLTGRPLYEVVTKRVVVATDSEMHLTPDRAATRGRL